MLVRERIQALIEVTDSKPSTIWASWYLAWQQKLHDVQQSAAGMFRKPMQVQLPNNDRKMSFALSALLATLLYVASLALLVHFVLGHAADGMDTSIRASMTVEVLQPTAEQKDWKSAEERLKTAQAAIRKLPGIIRADAVPLSRMRDLLKPWLGDAIAFDVLPLPLLLDIQLDPKARIDKNALLKILADIPGTSLDDHGRFMGQLLAFGQTMRSISFSIVLLGIAALILCAYFSAQATFYMNREMIEILHLIGAEDNAIAQHTGMGIMRLMLISCSVALLALLITLVLLLGNATGLDLSFFPNFDIGFMDWLVLILQWALLFGFAVGLCLLAARFTVLQALRRLL